SSVGPSLGAYGPYFVGGNQAEELVVLHHKKASSTGTQQLFVYKLTQGSLRAYHFAIARHHILNAQVVQQCTRTNLQIGAAGSLKKEPTNESDPQTSKAGSLKEAEN